MNQNCLETLSSIINGKGGFRDIPDPQEFRAAFRLIIEDKLLVSSRSKNYKIDAGKIFLDIPNVNILKKQA